jgi:hypothetical protein
MMRPAHDISLYCIKHRNIMSFTVQYIYAVYTECLLLLNLKEATGQFVFTRLFCHLEVSFKFRETYRSSFLLHHSFVLAVHNIMKPSNKFSSRILCQQIRELF